MEASLGAQSYSHVGGLFDYVLLVERDAVVDALPAISAHEDQERLRELARFCAPRGDDGTVSIATRSQTACWSFVLTDVTGARRYGTCLAFCWPPVPKTQGAPPAELQSTHSLCLLSRVPVADTARKLLRILHMLLSHRLDPAHAALSSVDAFTEVATQIVTEVPSAVGIRVRLRFAGQLSHDSICCHLSAPRELPSQDVSLLLLFQCLSIRHVLSVLACLCTERSVVFTSRSTSLPPRCWEAMLSLLWPLQWTLVYVPLLPDSLSTYLQAPTIFAYGVHTAALEEQVQEPDGLNGVVIVDLDADTVTGTDATPRLPKLAADVLHQSVRAVLHPGIEDVDDPFSDAESTTTGPTDDAIRERKIRCAFAAFFASLLLHVDAHIAGVETSEDVPEENDNEIASLTDQQPGFAELLKAGFLEDWSKSAGPQANLDLPFMEDFIQTQMVTVFVDQRRRWGQKVREATKDGVAEEVMLDFVDSPWEQLRRLAAVRNERSLAQAPSSPSSGAATSEEALLTRIERGGSAPPLYEVTFSLNRNQPVSLDGSATELPSRVHALSEKLNSAIMQSPVPAVPGSPASMAPMEEFYADGTAEPELVRFYQDQESVDDSEFHDAEANPDFLLVRNETTQQQTHRKMPPQQPEPEPEQLSYFSPANACDKLDSVDTKVLTPRFNAPVQWSSVDFWHARVSRLVDGLTATLCTRPKAAYLHLCRAAAYENSEQPLAALQDYVRAWCLDRFLRNDVGGGEIVLQRLCNAVGRIDSKIGPEAAILGYAVRGLNTATALADALIGQAGERQLGELLHQCVAIARSAVPEAPTPTPAEAEAVAEEESRLTPPFDSILARSSASLDDLDTSSQLGLRRSASFDYLAVDGSDETPPISPQARKLRRWSESIATTTVGQTPNNLRHRRSLSTNNFGTPSPTAVDTWERNERSVSRSNSSALNTIPDGAPMPISLADWVDANKSVGGLPPKMERLHGRGQVDGTDTDFLSFLPAARIGACAASEVCLRLLIRQFQAVALPGGLVCDEKQLQHIKSQPEYKEKFLDRVRDLQTYNPAVLPPDEKVCFFVNVYNTMAMHAYVELGLPTSLLGRLSLMKRASYAINDLEYSLYEIEHSVLRACASKPAIIGAGVLLSLAKFGESDPRHACRIEQVEPLLNFALCPGTASAPPLRVFTPADFHTQLRTQAETYCGQYIKLDEHKGLPRVTLPKLFDWYSEDFGGKEKVLLWLLGVLPEEQREELRVLVEAEYDSPVLGLDYPTEELNDARKRHDSVDSNNSKVSTGSRSSAMSCTVNYEAYKWEFRYFI